MFVSVEGSCCLTPFVGVISEKTGQGSPSSIQGGFERSLWQQNSARCCAARERFTLLFDR
jgi:hypothetical protein